MNDKTVVGSSKDELIDRVCRGVASIQEGQQLRAYIAQLEYDLEMAHGPSGRPTPETNARQFTGPGYVLDNIRTLATADSLIDKPTATERIKLIADLCATILSPTLKASAAPAESILDRKVTVCSACLCACCIQGSFYCDDYKTAGTVEKTIRELWSGNLRESSEYWFKDASTGETDYNAKSAAKRALDAERAASNGDPQV